MATLSRMFQWRDALVSVKPDTLIRWHRRGFRLFRRWRSRPVGGPRAPNIQGLIRKMAAENPTWGGERIANELALKLRLRLSPRTVHKCLTAGDPSRIPDPRQRWLTFLRNHAQAIVLTAFLVVVTARPSGSDGLDHRSESLPVERGEPLPERGGVRLSGGVHGGNLVP